MLVEFNNRIENMDFGMQNMSCEAAFKDAPTYR